MATEGLKYTSVEIDPRDQEFNTFAANCANIFGMDRLVRLMATHHGEKTGANYKLKEFLEYTPDYVGSAQQAGLTIDQAYELTIHLLESDPYKICNISSTVPLMCRVFTNAANRGHLFDEQDYGIMRSLVGLSAKYGVSDHAMYAYSFSERIGLSSPQSYKMISKPIFADGISSGYTFSSFNEALRVLNIAKVNPDLVVWVFDQLGGSEPYYNQILYDVFRKIIINGSKYDITPQEIMEMISKQMNDGKKIRKVLAGFFSDDKKKLFGAQRQKIIDPVEDRKRHFIDKPGNLETAGLPYRTRKSLKEGIADLQKIADASNYRWEEPEEGFFVFDPDSETWYSLGGEQELIPGGVRYHVTPYDISLLSDTPTMFHCHLKEYERMTFPGMIDVSHIDEAYIDQLSEFCAVTPSEKDYATAAYFMQQATRKMAPRSLIIHSLGITEFSYPNNVDQLTVLSSQIRKIITASVLDWFKGDSETVYQLMDILNANMPEGFSIKLYPQTRGTVL